MPSDEYPPPWEALGHLQIRVTLHPPRANEHRAEGRVEIETVTALQAKFGGSLWRRVSQSRRVVPLGYELSDTWINEYGVHVEVMV